MPTDDPKQNQQDLKALKLLGARAVVLETQHAGIASEFRALKARAKATRRADTTAESLAASKQGHLRTDEQANAASGIGHQRALPRCGSGTPR